MKALLGLSVVIAISIALDGCSTLPPILQRWADLEIATAILQREDSKADESLYFSEDGRVRVSPKSSDRPAVRWRVRGAWLEIDSKGDGTFQMRLRAITATKDRVVAEGPTGEKSVWRVIRVRFV